MLNLDEGVYLSFKVKLVLKDSADYGGVKNNYQSR
jgi:hypothetical protein